MVVLTGDIHHDSLNTRDQQYISTSELQLAREYVEIASSFNLSITLFISGKAAEEEPELVRSLAEWDNVEVGGHNYYCYKPKWLYRGLFERLLGCYNGPRPFQKWEAQKAISKLEDVTGTTITCWRNHAYRADGNTNSVLDELGIEYVSNDVDPALSGPFLTEDGVVSVPVNVMPDSDHMYHGWCTPNKIDNWELARSGFDPVLYSPSEWFDGVRSQVNHILKDNGVATLLVHPAPMKIVDNFDLFRRLCEFLSVFNSVSVSQIHDSIDS